MLIKRFVTSITSAVDLFLASLHWFEMSITSAVDSNPPYNYFMSNAGSWLLCIGLRRPLLLQWISSWLLFIPMSNGGMLTTRVDPNRARHHTSTSTNGNNSGNQSYTSN
ncbi:hypothetical protein HYC85_003274 [Camellia sinensis]|uniref:Uncharacterized protein n=1 Tax=Camellia sinensis TaxID=4442 RepID=A0A7J7IB17_CAMSI|nr:hypothetical protein HYC85_003274 [Camellia sinensis]